jgi:hypothetical protein
MNNEEKQLDYETVRDAVYLDILANVGILNIPKTLSDDALNRVIYRLERLVMYETSSLERATSIEEKEKRQMEVDAVKEKLEELKEQRDRREQEVSPETKLNIWKLIREDLEQKLAESETQLHNNTR